MGRVTGPDGSRQVLLARGDTVVSVVAGTTLDNGYTVEVINAESVTLLLPATGYRTQVAIPADRE